MSIKHYDINDIIKYLLYSPVMTAEGLEMCYPVEGVDRLMFMLFLFEKELVEHFEVREPFGFIDYKYNPWSHRLYQKLLNLLDSGHIEAIFEKDHTTKAEISLTQKSIITMESFNPKSWISLNNNQRDEITRLKTNCVRMSIPQILTYINAVYREDILGSISVMKNRKEE